MRIAYVCADFGIPVGGHKGASVHVRALTAALVAQGHDVRIFTPNPGSDGGNVLAAGVEEVNLEGAAAAAAVAIAARSEHPRAAHEGREIAFNRSSYEALIRHFAGWRPDAVYERYSIYSLAGIGAARRLRVPHLLEVNAILRLERQRARGVAFAALAGRYERQIFSRSDRIFTVSTALERYVVAHGSSAARTMMLANGVDTDRFRPDVGSGDMRARFGIPAHAFVIGFAGSLKPWHGTDVLVSAFARLLALQPGARLLIVGEGPQGAALRDQARRLGITPAIAFTGAVEHHQMPMLLAAMDVAVAPYLALADFYFSPLKVYEYMAAGLPIVASALGDIPALVPDGELALLTKAGDVRRLALALERLMNDPGLRARLGASARRKAERHTWDANARVVTSSVAALAGGDGVHAGQLVHAGPPA